MKSFAYLLVTLFLALLNGSTAFTTRPTSLTTPPTAAAVTAKNDAPLTTQQMFVDWGAPEITNAPAIGSIYSLVACVAIWELVTPGRWKKDG